MVENIFEYIEILLPRHKCITLPGMGAFILNKEDFSGNLTSQSKIAAPSYYISFNSRLQHDDGVLSSYIQSRSGISYESASKELANSVKQVRLSLLTESKVQCGSLGDIELSNNNIVFTQNKDYVVPLHYGLTPVELRPTVLINRSVALSRPKVVDFRKKAITVAASAAAVLLLTLSSTNISDNFIPNKEQQAGYLSSLTASKYINGAGENTVSPLIEDMADIKPSVSANIEAQTQSVSPQPETTVANKVIRPYYIILGGSTAINTADQIMEKLKAEGFSSAQIVSSAERHRVYIESFDNKQEAEMFLIKFRRDNPQHNTAWLYYQRN